MSDTKPAALLPYMPVVAFKPKDAFGQPKPVLNRMEKDPKGNIIDGQKADMGVIFGTARKIGMSVRTSPDGEVTRAFCVDGNFEAIPVDRSINPQRTTRAWLAEHILGLIREQLKFNDPVNGTVNEDGAEAVEFSFIVGIESASRSTAGFKWTHVPTMEVKSASDPLAHLRALLPASVLPPAAPQLEAPEPEEIEDGAEVPVSEEPHDAAPKGKGGRHKG